MQKGNRHMIWLLQLEIMKLFHCSQVCLDRERWTNLRNPGTLVSLACDCNRLFPKTELEALGVWEHLSAHVWFCLQTSQPYTINSGPVTANDFVQDSPIPSQQFRAILHWLHSVLQDCFSFPNLCNERDQPNLPRHKDILRRPEEHCLRQFDA